MSFISNLNPIRTPNVEVFKPTDKTYQNLMNVLNQRVKGHGGNITDTALFRTGVGQLQDVSKTLADAQMARSAASGTLGTETDIAAGAGRAQALSQGIRGLIQTVQADKRTAENQDYRNLMNVLGAIDRNLMFEAQLEEQRRRDAMQLLSSGVGSIVSAINPVGAAVNSIVQGAGGGGGINFSPSFGPAITLGQTSARVGF